LALRLPILKRNSCGLFLPEINHYAECLGRVDLRLRPQRFEW
jgi:hypothetical protein